MRLLCPNCQKELTVLEQYAGQVMKCPLCAGTFTVPALPQTPAPASPPLVQRETYSLAPEPSPSPIIQPRQEPALGAPEESLLLTPAEAPPPPPGEYQHTISLAMRPEVVPWIAPGALLVVFLVFLIFSWVGLYPGGYGIYTQTGWQAAFDSRSVDEVWANKMDTPAKVKESPGVAGWLIVYFFMLLLALLLSIAAVVLPLLSVNLPPAVRPIMPWRWAIAGGMTLLAFLFLVIQLLVSFPLESKVTNLVDEELKKARRTEPKTEEDRKIVDIERRTYLSALGIQTTSWLRLSVFLHVVALAGAGLQFWLDWRGNRLPPRIDLLW